MVGLDAWLPDYIKENRPMTYLERWSQAMVYQSAINNLPHPGDETIQKWIDEGQLTEDMLEKVYERKVSPDLIAERLHPLDDSLNKTLGDIELELYGDNPLDARSK